MTTAGDSRTSSASRRVVVLGASPKPARYAFRAVRLLLEHGFDAIPVNPAFDEILGRRCYPNVAAVPQPVDTVTLYVGSARSTPLIDDIIAVKPARVIMNPGAENDLLEERAAAAGIEVIYGCTLVMLQSREF